MKPGEERVADSVSIVEEKKEKLAEGIRTLWLAVKLGYPLGVLAFLSYTLLEGGWNLDAPISGSIVATAFVFSFPWPFLYFLYDKVQRKGVFEEVVQGARAWNIKDETRLRRLVYESIGDRSFFWPVLVATTVVFPGWIIVLLCGGSGIWTSADSLGEALAILVANTPTVIFGFLGAYFFGTQYLIRRFLRADLKPGVYTALTIRILSSMVIAYLLSIDGLVPTAVQSGTKWVTSVLAFLVGLAPYVIIVWIQDRVSSMVRLQKRDDQEDMKLDKIQGLTSWDEARFLEEGIENVQHLATASAVDLLVRTRFGRHRIHDWIDQAYLLIHLDESSKKLLHSAHIRSATDFMTAYVNFRPVLLNVLPNAELLASSLAEGPNADLLFSAIEAKKPTSLDNLRSSTVPPV